MKRVEVTRINIRNEERLKAFCDIVLYEEFAVKGITVIDNGKGLFISFPAEKGKDGEWYDICHPITSNLRMIIEREILNEYKLRMNEEPLSASEEQPEPII